MKRWFQRIVASACVAAAGSAFALTRRHLLRRVSRRGR